MPSGRVDPSPSSCASRTQAVPLRWHRAIRAVLLGPTIVELPGFSQPFANVNAVVTLERRCGVRSFRLTCQVPDALATRLRRCAVVPLVVIPFAADQLRTPLIEGHMAIPITCAGCNTTFEV